MGDPRPNPFPPGYMEATNLEAVYQQTYGELGDKHATRAQEADFLNVVRTVYQQAKDGGYVDDLITHVSTLKNGMAISNLLRQLQDRDQSSQKSQE